MTALVPLILLLVAIACLLIGKHLQAEGRRIEDAGAQMKRAAGIAAKGKAELFNAVQSAPEFDRPVLVWICPSCNSVAFVPKDCPYCTHPMPKNVPITLAREADVITQGRPRS